MTCPNCGAELQPGATFCTNCGTAVPVNTCDAPAVMDDPGAGTGKVALILGIVSLALNCICACFFSCLGSLPGDICAIIAIIMGVMGMSKSKNAGFQNKSATIGLILGIVALVVAIVFIVLNAILGGVMGAAMSSSGY